MTTDSQTRDRRRRRRETDAKQDARRTQTREARRTRDAHRRRRETRRETHADARSETHARRTQTRSFAHAIFAHAIFAHAGIYRHTRTRGHLQTHAHTRKTVPLPPYSNYLPMEHYTERICR